MPIFRKGQGKHSLAAAMAAVKMGDRLLQIGCSDGALLGSIASKAGLSGRACVIVESEADAARGSTGAARSGTLVEVDIAPLGSLPYDDRSFDVVVIDSLAGLLAHADPAARTACLRDLHRVLAPRGRVVVIERIAPPGLAGWISREPVDPEYRGAGGAAAVLKAEGFGLVRVLAERDGLSFVEAIG